MLIFPNAKINLGLYVTEKRTDGYHNISSLMYPIKWSDMLEIIENKDPHAPPVSLSASGIHIAGHLENNLVYRAVMLLKNDFSFPSVNIHLHKIVPMGAGLGGGSADAAYAIKLVNESFHLGLNTAQMCDYCRKIGSDCAFFIDNKPAIVSQKGDILKPYDIDLSDFQLIIIVPDVAVNTANAYAHLTPQKMEYELTDILHRSVYEWKDLLRNDFEKSIFSLFPQIKTIKDAFYDSGAVYASMSGSGSAVFGLFKKEKDIRSLSFGNSKIWTQHL